MSLTKVFPQMIDLSTLVNAVDDTAAAADGVVLSNARLDLHHCIPFEERRAELEYLLFLHCPPLFDLNPIGWQT